MKIPIDQFLNGIPSGELEVELLSRAIKRQEKIVNNHWTAFDSARKKIARQRDELRRQAARLVAKQEAA